MVLQLKEHFCRDTYGYFISRKSLVKPVHIFIFIFRCFSAHLLLCAVKAVWSVSILLYLPSRWRTWVPCYSKIPNARVIEQIEKLLWPRNFWNLHKNSEKIFLIISAFVFIKALLYTCNQMAVANIENVSDHKGTAPTC